MADQTHELAREALTKIDELLRAKQAEGEFQDMSVVTRTIVRMRDDLISRLRAQPAETRLRERLDRVNALVSMTASAEMPLQGIHWDRIKKTRDLLAEMADAPEI